jgi:hypothetical protein
MGSLMCRMASHPELRIDFPEDVGRIDSWNCPDAVRDDSVALLVGHIKSLHVHDWVLAAIPPGDREDWGTKIAKQCAEHCWTTAVDRWGGFALGTHCKEGLLAGVCLILPLNWTWKYTPLFLLPSIVPRRVAGDTDGKMTPRTKALSALQAAHRNYMQHPHLHINLMGTKATMLVEERSDVFHRLMTSACLIADQQDLPLFVMPDSKNVKIRMQRYGFFELGPVYLQVDSKGMNQGDSPNTKDYPIFYAMERKPSSHPSWKNV